MSLCKLCLEDKQLIKKSHIIPDFIYKWSGMYDSKHRINVFTLDDIKEGRKIKKVQTGVYEGGILCSTCDNEIIGRYEGYAKKLIYGGLKMEDCPTCVNYGDTKPTLTICSNVDYQKFKLFLLSILFRSAISSNPFFEAIEMNEENLENLRRMVFEGDAAAHNDYPVMLGTFARSEDVTNDTMISPGRLEKNGLITHSFIFGGMAYMFHEGVNVSLSPVEHSMVLKPDNKLNIFHFDGEKGKKYFNRFIGLE